MSEKFTLMHAEKATFTIELMARLLSVSRAGYYAWAKRRDTIPPTTARRVWLSGVITQIHDDSHGVNGFRRVLAELSRRGIAASEGSISSSRRCSCSDSGMRPPDGCSGRVPLPTILRVHPRTRLGLCRLPTTRSRQFPSDWLAS